MRLHSITINRDFLHGMTEKDHAAFSLVLKEGLGGIFALTSSLSGNAFTFTRKSQHG